MNYDKNDWQQFMQWVNELPPIEDLDIKYNTTLSYFPFINRDKRFFPVYKLLRDAYLQFSLQILIIIVLIFIIKSCIGTVKESK